MNLEYLRRMDQFGLFSLTHRTIAEFAGTMREIVTLEMNRLRIIGLIRYSRKLVEINTEAMVETLRAEGIAVPERPSQAEARRQD